MIELNKMSLLLPLILIFLGGCTPDSKPSAPPAPVSTLPLDLLTGTWEVSDAVRNGKNTTALEGIYFTFTGDEQLTSNFNLSLEEQTFPYIMRGDTLITRSNPERSYLIESLTESELKMATKMENYFFKLTLATQDSLPAATKEES